MPRVRAVQRRCGGGGGKERSEPGKQKVGTNTEPWNSGGRVWIYSTRQGEPLEPQALFLGAQVKWVSFKSCQCGLYTETEIEETVVKRGNGIYSRPCNELMISLPRLNPYHALLQYA